MFMFLFAVVIGVARIPLSWRSRVEIGEGSFAGNGRFSQDLGDFSPFLRN